MANTSTARLAATDYTVACICPMGIEAAPVEAMLDEIHDPLSFARDHNAYTLGKIGQHNVVVAVMHEIGNNVAAVVATQLMNDFPAVRFGLLVGIGGGVPGAADVRLGDVVVSQPTATFGGVVQFDMGKKLAGGGYLRTGSLNKPPTVLRASVRKLDAEHRRRGNQLSEYLSEMTTKHPFMRATYSAPATDSDRLFLSTYIHRSGSTCDQCDQRQTVRRIPRLNDRPHIHYGTIGSANMVIKDAQVRDELNRDISILCVEMEAAGLMDNFPCLVIRGICDYADSHKNKRWQPYAAGVAAAYMKALLLATPARQVAGTERAAQGSMSPFRHGIQLGQAPVVESHLFIGRSSELQTMEDILQPRHAPREQRRLVLGGMGGVGKTQLAIMYAKRHYDAYESIFWLNATSEAELKQSFRKMAQRVVAVEQYQALDDEQIVLSMSRWLSHVENTRWLLIVDNYDDPDGFDLWRYCPYSGHGSVIVTSRLPDQVSARPLIVRPLDEVEHGIQILQTRSGRDDIKTDPHVYQLAERMQGLPLALATAGVYLRHSEWTCGRYLEEYNTQWHVGPRRQVQLQDYQGRTLYTTWNLSYRRLEEKDANAAKLLKLLAYFDNRHIWYELLSAGLTDQVPGWLHETVTSDVSFSGTMSTLTEYCFVEAQWSTQSWSIHNCVHDWALTHLNCPLDPSSYWYTFDCVTTIVKQEDWKTLDHIRHTSLVPHAIRLADHKFNDIGGQLSGTSCRGAVWVARLLRGQMQVIPAKTMYLRALAGYEKALGPNHTSTLDTVNNLGLLYEQQDKLEQAEQMYTRALAGYEKALGPNHTSTLDTVNNLGILYWQQGKLEQAKQMYTRALAGKEKALGPNHTSTLGTVNNLGILYRDQGKLEQAEQMYTRALAGKEKALGPNHTLTLDTVNNLGILYARQSKLVQAEQMYTQALAGTEKALGPNHTSTLDTVNNLGLLYAKQGKLVQAEQMYTRALAGYEKALGPNHTSTLDTVRNFGVLYAQQGKLEQAEQNFQRVVIGWTKTFGPTHPRTLRVVNNLNEVRTRRADKDRTHKKRS